MEWTENQSATKASIFQPGAHRCPPAAAAPAIQSGRCYR